MFDDFEWCQVTKLPPRWKRPADVPPSDIGTIAKAWIAEEELRATDPKHHYFEDLEWDTPFDLLFSLTHENPELAWGVICELAASAPEELLPIVGIGPLETFLNLQGEQYIERIEREADLRPRFRFCLYEARPAFGGPVFSRLVKAAGIELPS